MADSVPGKVHELHLEKLIFGPMSLEEVQARTTYVLRAVHYHEDLVRYLDYVVAIIEELTVSQRAASGLYSIGDWDKIKDLLAKAKVKAGRDPAQGEGRTPGE